MNRQPWHFVVAHEKDSPYGFAGMRGVQKRVGLPARYDVLAVVPFGYPARPVKGIKKRSGVVSGEPVATLSSELRCHSLRAISSVPPSRPA